MKFKQILALALFGSLACFSSANQLQVCENGHVLAQSPPGTVASLSPPITVFVDGVKDKPVKG
jgi:hypothetical protein